MVYCATDRIKVMVDLEKEKKKEEAQSPMKVANYLRPGPWQSQCFGELLNKIEISQRNRHLKNKILYKNG